MNRICLKSCLLALLISALNLPQPAAASGPWHAARQNTAGWQYMTPDERIEHQRKMRSFKNYDDCRAYQDAHHAQMAARALRAGSTLQRHANAGCEQLRQQGKLK